MWPVIDGLMEAIIRNAKWVFTGIFNTWPVIDGTIMEVVNECEMSLWRCILTCGLREMFWWRLLIMRANWFYMGNLVCGLVVDGLMEVFSETVCWVYRSTFNSGLWCGLWWNLLWILKQNSLALVLNEKVVDVRFDVCS